jgi:hypothetical protein
MTISISSPVTGSAQTGLTTPTYTLVEDVAPDVNAKQYAVTALGGTQSGVTTHSVSSPFTVTFWRPRVLKVLQAVTNQLALLGPSPRNKYSLVTRKGVLVLAGQPAQVLIINTQIEIPAGAEAADPEDVRAALSAHIGSLDQISSGFGDTAVSGVM